MLELHAEGNVAGAQCLRQFARAIRRRDPGLRGPYIRPPQHHFIDLVGGRGGIRLGPGRNRADPCSISFSRDQVRHHEPPARYLRFGRAGIVLGSQGIDRNAGNIRGRQIAGLEPEVRCGDGLSVELRGFFHASEFFLCRHEVEVCATQGQQLGPCGVIQVKPGRRFELPRGRHPKRRLVAALEGLGNPDDRIDCLVAQRGCADAAIAVDVLRQPVELRVGLLPGGQDIGLGLLDLSPRQRDIAAPGGQQRLGGWQCQRPKIQGGLRKRAGRSHACHQSQGGKGLRNSHFHEAAENSVTQDAPFTGKL